MALFLNQTDIRDLLTMEDAIDAVEDGFRQWAQGKASVEPRMSANPPAVPGQFYLRWFMPALMHGWGVMGAKHLIVPTPGAEPPAPARYLELLFDSRTGNLLAVVDEGFSLTQIRTGAVTGVATKYLARPDSATLAIFGSAEYAPHQAVAVCAVRPIRKIKVYSPTPEHRRRFARELEHLLKREVIAVDRSQDALKGADIVVTMTNAKEPVFRGDLLEEGTFVSAGGSSLPDHREVDDQTVLRSKIVVEFLDQALKEAGDLVIPLKSGVITREHIYGQLWEIVEGKKTGRASPQEIILFKFNGMAVEDMACALRLYQRAKEQGRGQEVE